MAEHDGQGTGTPVRITGAAGETPDMDVIDLLILQHARIEDLFRRALATRGDERREAFDDLVRLLAVHETAEEEVVHPTARSRLDSGDDIVDARLDEERRAKQRLAALVDLGPDAPGFDAELMALRAAVLTHARYEERYEFGRLRQAVPADGLKALAGAVRTAERFAPTRPHPQAQSAAANVLLGPPLAVFDRVRDAIRDAGRSPGHGS